MTAAVNTTRKRPKMSAPPASSMRRPYASRRTPFVRVGTGDERQARGTDVVGVVGEHAVHVALVHGRRPSLDQRADRGFVGHAGKDWRAMGNSSARGCRLDELLID